MIKFDLDNLVIYSMLNGDEAIIFCKFLLAEKKRHIEDITKIDNTIDYLENKYSFEISEIINR